MSKGTHNINEIYWKNFSVTNTDMISPIFMCDNLTLLGNHQDQNHFDVSTLFRYRELSRPRLSSMREKEVSFQFIKLLIFSN